MKLVKHIRQTGTAQKEVGKKSFFFQPRLVTGGSNDVFEKEANTVADTVLQQPVAGGQSKASPVAGIQRKCATCEQEEKKLQRQEAGNSKAVTENGLDNYVGSLGSSGQNLPAETKQFFEPKFGYDFSNVKVHTDSVAAKSAQSVNALAYTTGNNIVFDSGEYAPQTDAGKKLLAHELTHVVQQGGDAAVHRKEPEKKNVEKDKPTSYIYLTGYGNMINGEDDLQGIADKEVVQKLSNLYNTKKVCWNGDYVGIELSFGTAPISSDGASPRTIPPSISIKLSYKEAGGFTSYKYEAMDSAPVWFSGGHLSANWLPNIQTFFTYPLNKKGVLDMHLEMMDIEDDRLLVYDDKIDFTKCNIITTCRENAIATNRWAVIPDDGGPIHPLTGTADDGERYEIYKAMDADNYFICTDENTRMPVDRQGYQPEN